MPRNFPILYPAPEVQEILVSSLPGVGHAVATAQHWLDRGHYIFDAVTKKALTVVDGELCTIVPPHRVRTAPLAYEDGGADFDISRYRYVYTEQVRTIDRAVGENQRAQLAAGVPVAQIPQIRGWTGKPGGVGQFNHPDGILRLEGLPDAVLEPAERACKAWLRAKVPFQQQMGVSGLLPVGLVVGSRGVVRHPRSVGSADDALVREAPKAVAVVRRAKSCIF